MNVSGPHLSGATIGALIGFVSARYGWNVSEGEAIAWGGLIGSVGASILHIASTSGLWPAFKRALLGPGNPPAPPA